MRQVYCRALTDAAEADGRVFALNCDLVSSIGTGPFAKRFPERHLNCGIQEANACGVAAGLSRRGFVPFLHSFGVFASRRILDQIYISCAFAGLNVKIVGADPGVTAAVNGGTHMALEDGGILRVVPGATILEPSDPVMMYKLTRRMAAHEGVDYLRMARKAAVRLYEEDSEFEIGKAAILREGEDVTLIASGIMVYEALKAADRLGAEGIRATVVDMFTVKPLDVSTVVACAKRTGAVVTAENHNVIGYLGSAVAEALGEHCPVPLERVGVLDRFGEVGSQEYLMERFELTEEAICQKARRAIARKH
jgi:transketolase